MLKKSIDYDSQAPPTLKLKKGRYTRFYKTEVHASINILSINDFNEEESKMHLIFDLELRWKDKLLNYNFLKNDDLNNSVKSSEDFWKPHVLFNK